MTHARPKFLWRLAVCVTIAWAFGSFAAWYLRDWPVIVAAFNAPLWATLGAAYVEDHYRRKA